MTSTSHGKADLTGLCVLIAEDDFLIAMSLEASVEDLGGGVMGPVAQPKVSPACVGPSRTWPFSMCSCATGW